MSKQMKKTIFGILGGIVLMLLIAYLPPETEMMSRQGWQYLGCFGFLLTCLISGALPDWVATLATMVMLLVFKLGKVADVTVEFSGTTVWLCIGVFIMSVGINNSGFMKRLALWVLTKFPGTYRGQVTAMMLAGIITTPMIPSSYAKTSIMAPLIGQVCEAVGAEPNSKAARGLWFANFMGTYILGIAFMSGSAFVALMIGFMQGLAFTWGSWLKCTIVWYLVLIVLTYLYCTIICKPKEKLAGDVTFLKEQYKALGAVSKKEKQGIIIVAIAIILWITQKLHGVDAGFVAIAADVAFFAAGLLTAPEANAKGQWTLVVFIGGILSIAKFMNTTGVSAWLASLLGPIFAPIMSSPYIFVPCLCIITFALRYVIVSQTCMLTMMIAIFGPLMEAHGMSMFILVFVEWLCGTYWNTAYGNPSVVGFIKMTGDKCVDYKCRDGRYIYVFVNDYTSVWPKFAKALRLPEEVVTDPRFTTKESTTIIANRSALVDIIREYALQRDAQDILDELVAYDVPSCILNQYKDRFSGEWLEQSVSNGYLVEHT